MPQVVPTNLENYVHRSKMNFGSLRGNSLLMYLFFIAWIATAFFCEGAFHADEHFQILEFANWKKGYVAAEELPWEFREQMRPAIQPAIACGVWNALEVMGCYNPFRATIILRILSALLAFGVGLLMLKRLNRDYPSTGTWNLLLVFGLWFSLFCGVRFSSENWSGLMFALGFVLLVWPDEKRILSKFLIAGFVLGLSFVLRFQSAFLVAGLAAWLLVNRRLKWNSIVLLATGGILAIAAGVLTDRWFYGKWVNTAWNYFNQNLVLGKVNSFGIDPWYKYFEVTFLRGIPPLSIVVIAGVLLCIVLKPKHALSFTLLPFLLVHFIIAHKEGRFMFPLVPLVPLALVVAYHAITEREKLRQWYNTLLVKWTLRFALIANVCLLPYVIFFSGNRRIELFRLLYTLQQEKPITVYALEPSPMHNIISMTFYNGPNMTSTLLTKKQLKALEPKPGDFLIIPQQQENQVARFGGRLERIYSGYPDWVLRYNFNNWTKRTGVWRIYRVRV